MTEAARCEEMLSQRLTDFLREGMQRYSHADLSCVSPDWSRLSAVGNKKHFQASGNLLHPDPPQNAHSNERRTGFGFSSGSFYLQK